MSIPTIVSIPWNDIIKKFSFNKNFVLSTEDLYNSKKSMKSEYVKNQPFVFNAKYYYGIRKGICDNIESYFRSDHLLALNLLLNFQELLNDITVFKSLFEKRIMDSLKVSSRVYEIVGLNYNGIIRNKYKYSQQNDKNLISMFIENDVHFLGYKVPFLNKFPIITRFNASRNILGIELEKTFLLRPKNAQNKTKPSKKITFSSSFKLFLDKNNNWKLLDDNIYQWKIYVKWNNYEVEGRQLTRHFFVKDDAFSYHNTAFSNQNYNQNNINTMNQSIYTREFFANAVNQLPSVSNVQFIPTNKLKIETLKEIIKEYSGFVGRGINLFLNNQFYTRMPLLLNFTESSHINDTFLHISPVHKSGRQNSNITDMDIKIKFIYAFITKFMALPNFIRMIYKNIFGIDVVANPENINMCYNNIIHYKNQSYFEVYNAYPVTGQNDEGMYIHSYCFNRFRIYFDTKRNYRTMYMTVDVYITPVYNVSKEEQNTLIQNVPLLKKLYKKHTAIKQFVENGYNSINRKIIDILTDSFRRAILSEMIRQNPTQSEQLEKQFADLVTLSEHMNYVDFYITLENFVLNAIGEEMSSEQLLHDKWKDIYVALIQENKKELDKVSFQFEQLYYDIIEYLYQYI